MNINEFTVINDGVARRVNEKRNIFSTRKRRIGLDLNWLLNNIVEGKIEFLGRCRRRRKQLVDALKKIRGCRKLKGEVLYGTADNSVWKRL